MKKNCESKKLSHDELKKIVGRKKIRRVLFFLCSIFFFMCVGGVAGIFYGASRSVQKLKNISVMPNAYTSIIFDHEQHEIDRLNGSENREYITLDKIPKNLQRAFIAIEDERFYEHNGIDIKALFRAVISKIIKHKTQGASTITQQLIKNNIMHVAKNNLRTKIQEQYLAVRFERELNQELKNKKTAKDHILEVYLNTIYLYHGLNGVKTAASYYFNKDTMDLTLDECCVIAAITKSPTYYAPDKNPDHNKLRRDLILNKMRRLEYITQDELEHALTQDTYAKLTQRQKNKFDVKSYHSYFVDKLVKDLTRDIKNKFNLSNQDATNLIYNGGLKIYATIDSRMQSILDKNFCDNKFFPASDFEIEANYFLSVLDKNNQEKNFERKKTLETQAQVQEFINSLKQDLVGSSDIILAEKIISVPQPQAAMIVIDYRSGEVKAITGGRGDKLADLALNRATDSKRQPGSVFKILASYAPAIDSKKVNAATIIIDEEFTAPDGYSPKNYYKNYRGPSTIRDGIRDSMNILAVKNMINTGLKTCFDYLISFGFTTLVDGERIGNTIFSDKVASTALGGITHGVNQLEVTAAYGTIANLGVRQEPIFYTHVLDHNGNILLENKSTNRKVLSAQTSYILTDMMRDVITKGTGTKARFAKLNMPIAGKTGTTSDTKDLTFVGYTPYYVAGIWLGFDQPKSMREDRGYHLRLWSDTMEKIHAGLSIKDFEKPAGLTQALICKKTGELAIDSCESTSSEYFILGTEPKKFCELHKKEKLKDKTTPTQTKTPSQKNEPVQMQTPEQENSDVTEINQDSSTRDQEFKNLEQEQNILDAQEIQESEQNKSPEPEILSSSEL